MITISPSTTDIQKALVAFLAAILPSGVDIVEGQDNLVPQPSADDHVVLWRTYRGRLDTNVHETEDVLFQASITGGVMTVSSIVRGEIKNNTAIFGANISDGTQIISFGSGTGGVGTYNVSPGQANVASQQIAAGYDGITQSTELIYQIDVHGPNSDDNTQVISTLFRDAFAVDLMHGIQPEVTPLFTSEPRQVPFAVGEQQFELRWVIEAHLQIKPTVIVQQQFADAVEVDVISVEAAY